MTHNKKRSIVIVFIVAAALLVAAIVLLPMSLKINGDEIVSIECGEEYVDEGASFLGKELDAGTFIDSSKPGTYRVEYSVLWISKTRIINVVDTISPAISLNGGTQVYLTLGDEYQEYGASSYDEVDGDLSGSIIIEGNVDPDVCGEYTLSYYSEDSSGNKARARRKIIVTQDSPMTASLTEFDLNNFYSDVICQERAFDAEKYDQICFYGDSFVGMYMYVNLYPNEKMYHAVLASTDNLDVEIYYNGVLDGVTLFEALDKDKPNNILVFTDNYWTEYWTPEYFKISYSNAIDQLMARYPDITFVLCSLVPFPYVYETDPERQQNCQSRNDRINKDNVMLCEIAREKGLKFLNFAEVLKDPNTGAVKEEYIATDIYHINDIGCQVILDYIKTHMDW